MIALNKKNTALSKIDGNIMRLLLILLTILALAVITKANNFLKLGNFQSMEKQLVEYGLMSLGVGICMISGGIDLSAVYIANLSGIIAALFMKKVAAPQVGTNLILFIIISVLIGLMTGFLCGAFNGILIAHLNIPPMLATLGTMQLFMGIAILISKGSTVGGIPKIFSKVETSNVFGVMPLPFVIYILVTLVIMFIMGKTKFGMRVYLLGTNQKASKFAGINNNKILIQSYIISGILAASAGLLSLARINSAKADFGSSFTMQTILISVLGGVNPNGGAGKVVGIFLATLIVQVISSYLNMFPRLSNYYRDMIWGISLIVILIINFIIDRKKNDKLVKLSLQ